MSEQTQERRIRIVLIGDQALLRASLGRFLASHADIEVAGEYGSGAEALEVLQASSPDVVILDLDVASGNRDVLIATARRAGYQGRFLIVASAGGAKELAASIRAGASGVFLKSEPPERLMQAIRLVASGAVWVDQKIIQVLAEQVAGHAAPNQGDSENHLTEREEEVLGGIIAGLTNRKIGDRLGVSEGTVKGVIQQLFHRTGVRTRSQLVRLALQGSLGAIGAPAGPTGALTPATISRTPGN